MQQAKKWTSDSISGWRVRHLLDRSVIYGNLFYAIIVWYKICFVDILFSNTNNNHLVSNLGGIFYKDKCIILYSL